jgi:hypothetical protein
LGVTARTTEFDIQIDKEVVQSMRERDRLDIGEPQRKAWEEFAIQFPVRDFCRFAWQK